EPRLSLSLVDLGDVEEPRRASFVGVFGSRTRHTPARAVLPSSRRRSCALCFSALRVELRGGFLVEQEVSGPAPLRRVEVCSRRRLAVASTLRSRRRSESVLGALAAFDPAPVDVQHPRAPPPHVLNDRAVERLARETDRLPRGLEARTLVLVEITLLRARAQVVAVSRLLPGRKRDM